ncbi:MAG: hypothetical protein ABI772_02420 [Bacteroidota bacterium]
MSTQETGKRQFLISRVATVAVILALIRCISETFRLNYYTTDVLTFAEIKPFLIGAFITAIALLSITILSFYSKHKFIIAVSILTIILLLIVKRIYFIP